MSYLPEEIAISIEELDDRLKAILRIKIREFVHLNPILNLIPSFDLSEYQAGINSHNQTQNNLTSPISQSRSDFKAEIMWRLLETNHREKQPAHDRAPRNFFAGHDQECPFVGRVVVARRPARRIFV